MRRAFGFTVLLAACASPPAARPDPVSVRATPMTSAAVEPTPSAAASVAPNPGKTAAFSVDAALAADASKSFPKRAVLRQSLAVGVDPAGKSFATLRSDVDFRVELTVVDDGADRLVVVYDDGHARLLLNGERPRFAPVATRAQALSTDQRLVPEPLARVTVAPGVVLEQADHDDAKKVMLVAGAAGSVTFHGWVPDAAVGRVFTPAPLPDGPSDLPRVLLDASADLSNDLGNFSFASFPPSEPKHQHDAQRLPNAAGANVLVRVASPEIEVVAFVRKAIVHPWKKPTDEPEPPRAWKGPAWSDGRHATLAANAPLTDANGGVIGAAIVASAVILRGKPPQNDAELVSVRFPLGAFEYVDVAVHAHDLTKIE